jgi:xanthine dehydrogenase accessory factor
MDILITERLVAAGLPIERVRALRAPIGLDVGARTPEEIAVSIVAEWLMVRQGGTGGTLRLDEELFGKAAGRGASA